MFRRFAISSLCSALLILNANSAVPLKPAGNGHLEIPVFVNGKGPFPFVLDTGADGAGIYTWFAKQQRFTAGDPDLVIGQTGAVSALTYRLGSVTVDGRTIRNLVADGYPDRRDQEQMAGVIGNDVMDNTITIFDFPCGQVSIWPKPVDVSKLLTPAAQMLTAGSVLDGTQLTFHVQIGKIDGIAVLDTGSRDTRINSRFARAAGIDPNSATFHDSDPVYGANSKGIASRQGPIGTVRFSGLKVVDAQVRVIDLPVFDTFGIGDGPAMIFGLDLMKNFRLVYDHSAKRFWFDRSKCSIE